MVCGLSHRVCCPGRRDIAILSNNGIAIRRVPQMLRVLYFTIVAQRDGTPGDGGILSSRTNILRLKQDDNIELAVVIAAPESARTSTVSFLTDIGVDKFLFIPVEERSRPNRLRDRLSLGWIKLVGFFWEAVAVRNPEVKQRVFDALNRWESDYLVIDYLFSALFCPDLELPTAIVTLNREAEFYRDCVAQRVVRHRPLRTAIAGSRLAKFERNAYLQSAKVIAIGQPDVPRYLSPTQASCITPYLDEQAEPWRFTDSRTAFFVGNISHYPNRLAIEFIARYLAPCIAIRRDDVRIKIIGVDAAGVPAEWRHPIVSYLGVSDAATVRNLFQTADLMLCPIKNDFGMKFKVAEAAAFATPFLASPETAKCVPHLAGLPQIGLMDPDAAADITCSLIGNRPELERLSALIRSRHRIFAASQKNIWSRTLLGAEGTLRAKDSAAPIRRN